MPLRSEATYLRDRAKRLREIAAIDPNSPLNAQLVVMAEDLEQRATDLERQQSLIESGVVQPPFKTG